MADIKYPNLFSPIKIGPLTLKNRIVAAPTSFAELSSESHFTRDNIAHYRLKAKGGASVITLGEGIVHSATGKSHPKQILLDDEGVVPSLVNAVDGIHQYGAIASIELSHGGMQCTPIFLGGRNPIGPSGTRVEIDFLTNEANTVFVEEMGAALMDEIAEAYAAAAVTVKRAGFDMCMIHAGHGWLLAQFLSPLTNKRQDKYGGSIENRARFPLMVIDRVRERIGRDFPLELRISGSEMAGGGFSVEDAIAVGKMVEDKVDLIHVSAGAFSVINTTTIMHPSMFLPHGCNVYLAEAMKKSVKIPVVTVGGLSDPGQMEEIVTSGKADIVAVARGLIADPKLPQKAKYGKDEEIVHCLRCFDCIGGMFTTRTMRCAVNPVIGREFESGFLSAVPDRKKVMVAGGGPAGLQAAITATERGHDVTLFEKSAILGGTLNFARDVPFKEELNKFKEYQIRKINSLDVDVRLNAEVTPEVVALEKPDVLIAAVGASPIVPSIRGVDNAKVVFVKDVYDRMKNIGQKVVVIGGGLAGCETGLYLAQCGRNVTIIEMQDDVALKANVMHRRALMLELKKHVNIYQGYKCTEILEDEIIAVNKFDKVVRFDSDTVVVAVGLKSRTGTVDALRQTVPEFSVIGDCLSPRSVLEAVRTGYDAGMVI